jgi:peptide/nickel transport system permease protein
VGRHAAALGRRARVSARIVITKSLGSLATLAFVVVFNFFLFRVVEKDPVATLFRGRNLSDAQRDELVHEFGLDGSKLEQFWSYIKQTLGLNFGRSYVTNQPVLQEIVDKAPATIALVGISAVLSAVFGILIGIAAAWRRNSKTDYAGTGLTMATYSMPDFWLGMLLLTVFAVWLGWFPVGGIVDPNGPQSGVGHLVDQAKHMFLPALTLTLAYLGEYALVMRSSLIDTMREDFLVLARAKGLRDVVVRNRHAVPNALLPVVTLVAINFGFVLSGAIAVETIFSWPGLGLATYEALQGPDLPMLQGLFLVFSAAVILFNLIADLLYVALDPRVRAA